MSRRGRRVKCTARRGAEQGTTLREYTGELRERKEVDSKAVMNQVFNIEG